MRRREGIHIGTSGWHYPHWVGPFYPETLRLHEFLGYYAGVFSTVEINNTFYRLPDPEVFKGWSQATPPEFVFACKASRYITHMKKLREPRDTCRRFLEATAVLGDKRGPTLFQLPPRWHVNPERLAGFLEVLPAERRFAIEFRDRSWFTPPVYELLRRRNVALCVYDLAGATSPLQLTADFVYLRLHGPKEAYCGRYDERALATWAKRILTWRRVGLEVYCYFDNDQAGFAVSDARRLITLIRSDGTIMARVP